MLDPIEETSKAVSKADRVLSGYSKYRSIIIDFFVFVVVVAVIGIAGAYVYHQMTYKVPVAEIPAGKDIKSEDIQTAVNNALKSIGSTHQIDSTQAKEITEKIEYRTQYTKPDYSFNVPTFSGKQMLSTEDKIKTIAKEEKRDEVVKHQVDDKTVNYYGITNDKRIAWGIYADIDKDGSYGLSYRNYKTSVAVGKKYKDASLTSRVTYDLIRH